MPLRGYVCPVGGEEPGRQNEVEYCLTKCSKPCVTPPLLAAMWKSDSENYHRGDYISASMLAGGGCSRQVMLERYEDFYDLPTKRYWPFRGTHAHRIVEEAAEVIAPYGWLQEIRMQTTLTYPELPAPVFLETGEFSGSYDENRPLQVVVRGTCDAYNPLTRTLVDCKSMSDAKIEIMLKGTSPGTYSNQLQDNWIAQLNIYRWLISRTPISPEVRKRFEEYNLPPLKGKTYPAPNKLFIQGIAMMSHPVSGSSIAHKVKGRGTTVYDLDDVPVWTLAATEEYVRPLALQWYDALSLKQLPPVVPESKKWMCPNCAFYKKACHPEAERSQVQSSQGE